MTEAAYVTMLRTMVELPLDAVTHLLGWQIARGGLTHGQAASDLRRLAALVRSKSYANPGVADALADALDAIAADLEEGRDEG